MFKFFIRLLMVIAIVIINGCGSSEKPTTNKVDIATSQKTSGDKPIYSSITDDPLFKYQWHLYNKNGIDLNVVDVWKKYQGYGINISIVDTGIESDHPDLNGKIDFSRSFRYSDSSNDPTPTKDQLENPFMDTPHGTAVAGIIAAAHNSIGVSGIAPEASLVGLNVFSNSQDSSFENAMLHKEVDVSSNSWGSNLGEGLDDDRVVLDAIVQKMKSDPTIFVFASGNEASNTNFSSVLSSRYTLPIGAVDSYGIVTDYSNFGANLFVVAPAGGDKYRSKKIVTTDLVGEKYGYDSTRRSHYDMKGNETYSYTDTMNGTSASVPMVSAVIALMLEANKNLSYRDVKDILVHSSKRVDKRDFSWRKNGAGILVSDRYGFGLIDASASVKMAETFTSLPKEEELLVVKSNLNIKIPDNKNSVVEVEFDVAEDLIVEYVELTINTDHSYSGDLKITLFSAKNTKSTLAYGKTDTDDSYSPWTFGSFQPYGESSRGRWILNISDIHSSHVGTLYEAKLKIYGHKK
jgi:subtilisin family serine protease